MDYSCHECGEAQTVWMVARCSNPNNKACGGGEAFCFKCLGKRYPKTYNNIFKGLWWMCPVCEGLCKCETCSDPVKKAEYSRQSKRRTKQRQTQIKQQTTATITTTIEETQTKPQQTHKLRSGTIQHKTRERQEIQQTIIEETENGWICVRCSINNNSDDIECIACGCHRKRNTRKRTSQEPVHEDKFHTLKETRRATEIHDDRATPVK